MLKINDKEIIAVYYIKNGKPRNIITIQDKIAELWLLGNFFTQDDEVFVTADDNIFEPYT